jgi:hypothetical protein
MRDQRADRNDERVEDLEVRGDEAREVAGGKKRPSARAAKKGGLARSQKKGSLGREA